MAEVALALIVCPLSTWFVLHMVQSAQSAYVRISHGKHLWRQLGAAVLIQGYVRARKAPGGTKDVTSIGNQQPTLLQLIGWTRCIRDERKFWAQNSKKDRQNNGV